MPFDKYIIKVITVEYSKPKIKRFNILSRMICIVILQLLLNVNVKHSLSLKYKLIINSYKFVKYILISRGIFKFTAEYDHMLDRRRLTKMELTPIQVILILLMKNL